MYVEKKKLYKVLNAGRVTLRIFQRRKRMKKKIIGLLFVVSLVCGMHSKVHADQINDSIQGQVQVVREKSSGTEGLYAVEISDEEAEQIANANQKSTTAEYYAGKDEKAFLSCGGDYGYRDMVKRSNMEGWQYLYRELKKASETFTTGNENAEEYLLNNTFPIYIVGKINVQQYQMTTKEMVETYFTFRNDNPQFFWSDNMVVYSSDYLMLLSYGDYEKAADRKDALNEIMDTQKNVYQSGITSTDSKYKKVLKIHDALIKDIEYDENAYSGEEAEISHSIAGAMTSAKTAVCEGYAKVMQLMMNCYDVENMYVTGIANGGGHAWNMVRMNDGKYYWLDATWDDQEHEDFQHSYFLVGNSNFEDHTMNLPTDEGGDFLYELPKANDTDYEYKDDEKDEVITGDVTGDGKVDIQDLRTVLRVVCDKETLNEAKLLAADVTGDGEVDIQDLRMILRYVCGKIDTWN